MKIISAEALAKAAPYRDIVEALRQGFREDIATPVRHHHETSPVSTLLLMPAWSKAFTGLKTVVVKTDNAAKGLPTITASYLLIDNATGATVAIMDGTELTRRRTAAASALAADYLARQAVRQIAFEAVADLQSRLSIPDRDDQQRSLVATLARLRSDPPKFELQQFLGLLPQGSPLCGALPGEVEEVVGHGDLAAA